MWGLACAGGAVYGWFVPISDAARSDLASFFESRDDVAFAFLFGSQATGHETDESDVDIAVYLIDPAPAARGPGPLEIETTEAFRGEKEIWNLVEGIVANEVDLVVLNRAATPLAASVIADGEPLVVKDEALLRRFDLAVSKDAEEFAAFANDFAEVKERSQSLSPTDRVRLLRSLDFLEEELGDHADFQGATKQGYIADRPFRRNLERWVENIVNATIDIAKTILASEPARMPRSYREAVENLGSLAGFDEKICDDLADFTRLRNMLAHEYLDLRFSRIRDFIDESPALYAGFMKSARDYL